MMIRNGTLNIQSIKNVSVLNLNSGGSVAIGEKEIKTVIPTANTVRQMSKTRADFSQNSFFLFILILLFLVTIQITRKARTSIVHYELCIVH